jgi:hypothetical protein
MPSDDASAHPTPTIPYYPPSYERLHHHQPSPIQDAGCQVSSSNFSPVTVIKEVKKLSLPHFDPIKTNWTSFAMKLHASLIECDMAYLLCEPSTNHFNSAHSKELMLELFKKLQGSALSIFTSLSAQ